VSYPTPAAEFEVRRLVLETGARRVMGPRASVEVYLLTEGRLRVGWSDREESFARGESFLIPACLPAWQLTALEKTTLFKVSVPA